MNRLRRVLAALAAVGLLAALPGIAISPATAQTTATVDVSATIGVIPSMSITVCASTAVFGSGLTNTGATPTGGDPGVSATTEGLAAGEGVFYVWQPPCVQPIIGTSNVGWQMTFCATENNVQGASPDVTVAGGDFRINFDSTPAETSYSEWLLNFDLKVCPTVTMTGVSTATSFVFPLALGMRVDDGDAAGDFVSQLTLGIVAA